MSRFLVCSSALLGQPGSPGATGDLRDCTTGVATLLDDSPMESDNRNGQFCEKQTCDFRLLCNPDATGCDVKSLNVCRIVTCPWFDSKARHLQFVQADVNMRVQNGLV